MKLLQGIKSNTFFSNSFFIFLFRLFPSLASLAVLIYFSRNLSQQAYGSYQNFWIRLNIFYPLACFGIHVVINTYSQSFVLQIARQVTRWAYFFYLLWLFIICSVFGYLQYKDLQVSFTVSFLLLLCFCLSFIVEAYLIVCRSFKGLIAINVFFGMAFWLAHWYTLQHDFSLSSLFINLLIIIAARLFLYLILAGKRMQSSGAASISAGQVRQSRTLWLHMGFYDVSQLLFSWIDKFIMSFVLTASLSAIYFNGSMNIPVLPLLLSAAGSAILLQMSGDNAEDNSKKTIGLINQSARLLSAIIFPVFLFLLCFRYELFTVLLTKKYIAAVPIFAISILSLPLKAYSFTSVLQNRHQGKIINIGAAIDLLLACSLMYPLYRLFGLPGVAFSFIITTYLQAAFYLVYAARLLQVSVFSLLPFVNWLFKLIIFSIGYIAIHYITALYFSQLISLILGIGLTFIIIAITLAIELKNQSRTYGSSEQGEV